VYDKHYRSQPIILQAAYAPTHYEAVWDQGRSVTASGAPVIPAASALSLEDLRRIAIEGFSGISRTVTATMGEGASEGKYISLPLEGRLDLMRPRPEPEKEDESGASADGLQVPGAGAGDQHTFDDRAGSLTPRMRPISFYVSDPAHDRPSSDSAPYEPHAPHFGPELGATVFFASDLSSVQTGWQPAAAAHRQIQLGPTSTFSQDQARSYYSAGPSGSPPLNYAWVPSQSGPEYSQGISDRQVRDVQGPYIGPQHATQSGGGTFPESGQIEGTMPGGTYPQGALGIPHGHRHFLPSERGHVSTSAVTWRPPLGDAEQILGSPQQHRLPLEPVYQVTQRQLQTYQPQNPKGLHVRGGDQVPNVSGVQQVHPDQGLSLRHGLDSTHQHGHQQPPSSQEPARPVSPPLVAWNPAVEPPPNVAPVSNFPATTYYPNVWDQSPSHYQSDSSFSQVTNSPHFTMPPPSRIPERLLQEKHYANVLGEGKQGETPSPDRAKIKPVFPWEDKPRSTPGRVFPATDSPPPGQFLQPAASPSPSPPLRFSPTQSYGSPRPSGFPPSFSYSNAWDVVPDIQRYASRLVRPPQNAPPLGPAFDFGESSRRRESALFKAWNESGESSVDGDDEDTGDEGGLSPPSKHRPRSGSFAGKGKRKEYRSQGVQTIPKETRDQSVQVTVLIDPADADRSIKDKDERLSRSREGSYLGVLSALAAKQQEFSPTRSSISGRQELTAYTSDIPKLSPLASPTGLRSPRYTSPRGSSTNLAESTPRPALYKPMQSPSTPQRGGEPQRMPPPSISRTFSSDTASSPSSAGPPVSPEDPRPVRRSSGRVWDPARGVEIFKKGSEEVLTRFLKMGSWEEEKQSQSPT
jgi:glycogenin glucosyltransferase